MMIFAAIFCLIGYVFAQQNTAHNVLNVPKCSHTAEPNISPLRVIVTVIIEEVAHPGTFTVSSLLRAANLDVSRRVDLSPTFHNSSMTALPTPQPYQKSDSPSNACSVSDTTRCRLWKLPSQSVPPHSTSRANMMEFTGSATRPLFRSVYLLLAISFRILRI